MVMKNLGNTFKICVRSIFLWLWLCLAMNAQAQTTVIYEDDFEGTVSGWTDNSTDFAPAVTNFLGRFADGQTTTSRTFTAPAGSDELVIEFDLYRFDSWDNQADFGFDRFELEINGTEIFSLAFPNPQAARSGSAGNVDWSHSPLTDRQELAFNNSGEFWFDQLHRFEVTVNNPAASVTLTLRAALSQFVPDESAGYDNFLVTAGPPTNDILAVTETFAAVDGDSGGTTPSVLSSDTINGTILNPSDVTITPISSTSPNVILNASTELITVAANTSAGIYDVEYEICETINLGNCSSVVETVTVFTAGGSASFCPVGTNAIPGTYHVLSATGGSNPNRAVGAPLAEGSQDTGANSGITFFPSVIYDLTNDPSILVPEGSVIEVSLAGNFNNSGSVAVSSALDNTNFPAAGSTGSQTFSFNNTNNTFEYFDYTVPAGGVRYMELDHLSGGIRFDGVIFDTICTLPPDVTIVAEDDSGSVANSSLGDTVVLNVLDNDTFDGATPTVFDLALAPGETLPTGLTFDTSMGEVEVLQDTLSGVYSFDYELCQAASATNCEIATVTITVTNLNPPSICPVGSTPIGGTFHVVSATGGTNPNRAVGAPLAEGSQDTGANSGITFFPSVIYDLTNDPSILVPEGSVIEVSLAGNFNNSGSVAVSSALDNTNFPAAGSTGSQTFSFNNTNNTFEYFDYTVPAGGVRYMELDHLSGGVRFDGVIYNTQCQEASAPATSLSANKSVELYDPQNLGLYAIPGNDVIYTISVANTGTGDVDSGSMVLFDNMPEDVVFYNGDFDDGGPETDPVIFQGAGSGLMFDYNTDVAFSNAATAPTDFASCTYTPASGYDPNVTFICFNPTGTMAGGSSWSISFRSRID